MASEVVAVAVAAADHQPGVVTTTLLVELRRTATPHRDEQATALTTVPRPSLAAACMRAGRRGKERCGRCRSRVRRRMML
jgi:hypothetical protein